MQIKANITNTTPGPKATEKTLYQRTKSNLKKAVAVAGVAASTLLPVSPIAIKAVHADPIPKKTKKEKDSSSSKKTETGSKILTEKQKRDFISKEIDKRREAGKGAMERLEKSNARDLARVKSKKAKLAEQKKEREFLFDNFGKPCGRIGGIVHKHIKAMKAKHGDKYTETELFKMLSSQAGERVNALSVKAERKAFPGDKDRQEVNDLKEYLVNKKGLDKNLFITLSEAQKKANELDLAEAKKAGETVALKNTK